MANRWSSDEIEFLKENADKMSDQEIADQLPKRTRIAVYRQRCKVTSVRRKRGQPRRSTYLGVNWDNDLLWRLTEASGVDSQTIQREVVSLCGVLNLGI